MNAGSNPAEAMPFFFVALSHQKKKTLRENTNIENKATKKNALIGDETKKKGVTTQGHRGIRTHDLSVIEAERSAGIKPNALPLHQMTITSQ